MAQAAMSDPRPSGIAIFRFGFNGERARLFAVDNTSGRTFPELPPGIHAACRVSVSALMWRNFLRTMARYAKL